MPPAADSGAGIVRTPPKGCQAGCAKAILAAPFPRVHPSDVEPEVHDIALADDVLLALKAQLAGLLRAGLALAGEIVVIADHLGTDEAALEIGMDHAGSLGRRGAGAYGP